ncbi:putative glycolipid-binding domain-containing protein [Saccharothrix obliqua]|uniref:putative glycolipid-binding domain-containing protein n=1 Tax=Saccharothrix obliqua TaxID=2861747 RepID=UPI001C5ECAB9|nr:putative glycolipid-binding domain-containing protein [Saccharothrix obliqua]MBW4719692.1 putative glycolipid-binding domain-containing protein [Saccharothrix obliqua]
MNSSDAVERATPTGEARTPAARIVTWRGYDAPRLEQVRYLLTERKARASGRIVAAGPDEQFSASFEVSVGETGAVTRLLLRTATVSEERQISVSRSSEGVWLVDSGSGAERADFDGALDVDVQSAVLFNAIPIRRLGLHREPGEHVLPVVYVSLPDLEVRLLRQAYRTVSVGEDRSVVAYESGDYRQDITVDRDGLVLDYPGVAHRI